MQMLNDIGTWLNTNREWVFSGIGVLILGILWWFWKVVCGFFVSLFKSMPQPLAQEPPPAQTPIKTVLTDSKIATLDDAMQSTHILFIDDDVKFKVISILQTAGWQHTRILKDVASLTEEAIKRAHILFVDINGVGKKLGFRDEGLGLALALKQRYPEKKVIIYSADTKAERFHEAWKRADDSLAKNADPYQFQQLVEEYAVQVIA